MRIMIAKLNEIEQQVYDALVCNARCYDENGNGCCFDDIDYKGMGLTFQQVKGYLSQLCQKGYIQVQRDGYFTHVILK